MEGYGSTTTIFDLPAEVIGIICQGLTLEDVANFQASNPAMDTIIDYLFFDKLKKMRLTLDEKGAMITLSPRSTHSYMYKSFSIEGTSMMSLRVIKSCTAVDSLTISCSDHHTDYSILDAINRAGITLSKLVVNIHTPKELKEKCRKTVHRSHRKLTNFVERQSSTLLKLKLSTSEEDSITVEVTPKDAASTSTETRVAFDHSTDSALAQSLVYPIFNAFNQGKQAGPSTVHLTVDWRDRLDLALQSAFMVALPLRHRSGARKMKIGFSPKVSSLTHDEMHSCLEAFSMSLSDTHRLQELLCDFTKSKIDPHQLERTISCLSSQLGSVHRIRVITDAPYVEDNSIKREWAQLPPVY